MSYTFAAGLAVALALGLDLAVVRTRLVLQSRFWTAYAIIVCFQLLANGFLTGRRIVIYDPDVILGLRVCYAPVEDLGFGFALVLATLVLWERLTSGS